MAQTPLVTFTDVVEELLDSQEIGRTELNLRNAIRAVQEAYRWLSAHNDWSYYQSRTVIPTVASYSTGTVTGDYTGGAYERMLTLATGTWPSWAAFGKITISGTTYTVSTRESDSIITLSPNSTFQTDIAAGTTYEIFQDTYELPVDYKRMTRLMDVDNEHEIEIVTDGVQQVAQTTYYKSPATPWQACIHGVAEYYGSLSLTFSPPPSTIREYDLLYYRQPRQLNIEKYNTGTVTVTGGATAVTGNSTVFPTDCVGSIIRFSSSATEPTGVAGVSSGTANRYLAQRTITARTSDTAITIDAAASSSTLTTVGYVISDPIDIEHHSMFGALRSLALAEYIRLKGHYGESRAQREEAMRDVRLAKEADNNAPLAARRVPYNPFIRTTHTEA